jgi:hypothetical protein
VQLEKSNNNRQWRSRLEGPVRPAERLDHSDNEGLLLRVLPGRAAENRGGHVHVLRADAAGELREVVRGAEQEARADPRGGAAGELEHLPDQGVLARLRVARLLQPDAGQHVRQDQFAAAVRHVEDPRDRPVLHPADDRGARRARRQAERPQLREGSHRKNPQTKSKPPELPIILYRGIPNCLSNQL